MNTTDLTVNDHMSALLARNWWAIVLRGVFAIVFGIVALLMPGVTLGVLALLFGAYMVVDGVFTLAAALGAARHHERWGLLTLEGVVDLIAGAIALIWPIVTIIAFIYLMGVWAIVTGGLLTAAAFRLHAPHGRIWMLLGGIVSMVWGILLFVFPLTGALVLTWWMAGYALFFGGALIVLGLRLRARRHERPQPPGALPQAS